MKVNTTIDNVSPLINYSPATAWIPGNRNDPFFNQYSQETFTLSVTPGATASFSFNGTGVWLFGALRFNHGLYNVTLDGVTTSHNGFAPDNTLFQQPLFSASGLAPGLHLVQLINDPQNTTQPFVDLDFITWETDLGDEDDIVDVDLVEDTDAAFEYLPTAAAWSTTVENASLFSGTSGHTTISPTGVVRYTFEGDAISIYGTVGPRQGPFAVQLDGGNPTLHTAINIEFHAQSLLYRATGLGPGRHEIVLANQPSVAGQAFTIDFAEVSKVVAIQPSSAASSTSVSSSSSSSLSATPSNPFAGNPLPSEPEQDKGPSTGVIVGAVAGVLGALAILFAILVLFRKRKRAQQEAQEPDMVYAPPVVNYDYANSLNGNRYAPPSAVLQNSGFYRGSANNSQVDVKYQEYGHEAPVAKVRGVRRDGGRHGNPGALYAESMPMQSMNQTNLTSNQGYGQVSNHGFDNGYPQAESLSSHQSHHTHFTSHTNHSAAPLLTATSPTTPYDVQSTNMLSASRTPAIVPMASPVFYVPNGAPKHSAGSSYPNSSSSPPPVPSKGPGMVPPRF